MKGTGMAAWAALGARGSGWGSSAVVDVVVSAASGRVLRQVVAILVQLDGVCKVFHAYDFSRETIFYVSRGGDRV
jgi:hypothetical protein